MSNVPKPNSLGSAPGQLPQREERLRKNFGVFFMQTDLPLEKIAQRTRTKKEKLKYPKAKFIRICLKDRFNREK